MEYKKRPLKERFEKHFEVSPSGCWEWTSQKCPKGYGRIKISGVNYISSRVAYELYPGEIPADAHVLHRCDNRSCVNPSHLFLGSHADNMSDMKEKGRSKGRESNFGGGFPGEQKWNAKLTESQVLEIRKDSRVLRLVASDYGVSISTISDIRTRRKWKHL